MARQSTHHLYRRKRNGGGYIEILYYVRFVDWKGIRRVFPAGTDYPIAKHLRDELLARNQLRYDFDEVPKKTIGFSAWVDDCLEAKKTKRAYKNYIEASLKPKEYFKSESIDSITTERTDDFKKWRYGQNTQYGKPPKPATVNRDVALIKMALRRAFDLGKITKLPSISLDTENNRRNRVASQLEFEKICEGMPAFARDVIVILYEQGMRISEGAKLLRSNIKLDENLIRLEGSQTKNGKPREMPMTSVTREIITRALSRKVRHMTDRLFVDDAGKLLDRHRVYKYFSRACKRAGVTGLTPHDLRATFSTRKTIDEGWDRELVKAIIGDTSDDAFNGYVRPKMADLKRAMEPR